VNRFRGTFLFAFAMIGVAGAITFSSGAFAQSLAHGEFKLAGMTHWEKAVLPEGEYSYSVDANTTPAVVRVKQKGGGFSAVFVAQSELRPNPGGSGEIVLRHVGDADYVSMLRVHVLNAALGFSVPEGDGNPADSAAKSLPRTGAPGSAVLDFIRVVNPNHLNLSMAEVERVYLNACRLIEAQFNLTTPVRPQLILRLGAEQNILRYPDGEIMLQRWDDFRFAQGVVEFALHDLVSREERQRLSDAAVNLSNTTVSLCELKTCKN
jgi:hypothetical protein